MSDDAVLLSRWARGDASAGEALYRAHFAVVFAFFRSKIDDDVDDLVQETFLVAQRRQPKFRGGSLRAFLLGIARYELLEWIRQRAKRNAKIDPATESLADLGTGPSSALRRDERAQQVRAALATLSLDQQMAVELRYWHELTMEEIGEVQEVAVGTVRTRLHRARKALRASLGDVQLTAGGLGLCDDAELETPALA